MTKSIIEHATLRDMHFFLDSANAEGWNPGLYDASPFYYCDPNGFFIEKLDNKPIGCISAVAYNESYGFMGFYIVSPPYRHQGYGIKLWDQAIAYLGDRVIGLDGVVAQQENYKKSGFQFHYNNLRFSGTLEGKISHDLQSIDTIPFQTLLEFDSSIYGIQRAAFLQHWITMPNSHSYAKMDGSKLLGYGTIRKCATGYKIGPLFANNQQIANEILLALATKSEGSELFFDVIQTNNDALDLTRKHHFSEVFETARMYKGIPPKQLSSKIFGVTTFELG